MRGDLTSVLLRHFVKYMNYIGAEQMLQRVYLAISCRIFADCRLYARKGVCVQRPGEQLWAAIFRLPGAGLCALISVRILTVRWLMCFFGN